MKTTIIILSIIFYIIITRSVFYLIDYYKSIQKPKFMYFKQFPFELMVSGVSLSVLALVTTIIITIKELIKLFI